jgi:mannose-6-phosphate isomerase
MQPYAWGSHTAIAELQGRPAPTARPEAELWMGAHPSGPSAVQRAGVRTTLDAVIAADPAGELGAVCAARFGGRLPFLLKVLAAEKALSIQVHPSREQAEAGYRAENERGLAPGDKSRNYADDWPKPEILCALTRFEVLAGMRTTADAAALLRALDVSELAPLTADLMGTFGPVSRAELAGPDELANFAGLVGPVLVSQGGPAALLRALATILTWPAAGRGALVASVVSACARVAAGGGEYAAACAAIARLAGEHPGDLGIVASLLLRYVVLRPGEAIFMPAGGPHAYLRGTGVELLANSDNVVRAGLTPKHLDVPELLKITDPAARVPVIEPRPLGGGVSVYDSPAPEFRLYRAALGPGAVTLPGAGCARVALCTEGTATLSAGSGALKLAKGESCYLPARDGAVTASGPAVLFIAGSGTGS